MAFAIKAEIRDPRTKTFVFAAQKTMYGGKHIAEGGIIFIFASENEGGQGLVARGIVTSAEAIARKRGIVRQTPRVSVTVRRTALAKRPLGRSELKPFTDWNDGEPRTELNFKFYRQATNKIIGISDAGNGNGNGGGSGNGGGNGNGGNSGNGGQANGGGGNGNSGSAGNSGQSAGAKSASLEDGKGKGKGKGAAKTKNISNQLGALNAAHASPTALAKASPKSRVGKIAAYQKAALASTAADAAVEDAKAAAVAASPAAQTAIGLSDAADATLAAAKETLAGLDPATTPAADIAAAELAVSNAQTAADLAQATEDQAIADAIAADPAVQAAIDAAAAAEQLENDALNAAANKTPVSPEVKDALDALLAGK